jgi:hypothetical protein
MARERTPEWRITCFECEHCSWCGECRVAHLPGLEARTPGLGGARECSQFSPHWPCPVCGWPMAAPARHGVGRRTRYCSDACKQKALRDRRMEDKHHARFSTP